LLTAEPFGMTQPWQFTSVPHAAQHSLGSAFGNVL
jgi:hypothetical protein